MSLLLNAELSHNEARSETFLLGLFVGLSLLLPLVVHLDSNYDSHLRTLTNIYGGLALAGAVLAFWRVWRRAEKPRALLSLPSVWICIGLSIWVIGQVIWIAKKWNNPNPRSPGLYDIAYIAADICWVVALLMIFKSLDRRVVTVISPILAIITAVLFLLIAGFGWLDHGLISRSTQLTSDVVLQLLTDLVYVLLTFCAMVLGVALLLGTNTELPFPVHQCLRYLFAATLIEAIATLAYVVTTKFNEGDPFSYQDGNWVDSLFLTAMFLWTISALKCPIRRDELDYTFGTLGSGISVEDIYRAEEIARHYSAGASDTELKLDSEARQWILDNIPECWTVAKLGDQVIGSTLLFPVPPTVMDSFVPGKTKESKIFEEVKKGVRTWDRLYLADASTLVKHRRRRIAFRCFTATIESIANKHRNLEIQVCCWPNSPQRKKLVEKLQKHYKDHKRVSVMSL